MDILCVDQRNAAARIAVTQAIPSIFRRAKGTIAVREGNGFQTCCVDAAGPGWTFFSKSRYGRTPQDQSDDIDFDDEQKGRERLGLHLASDHSGETLFEGVLTRLWPMQEILLSDNITFVRCDRAADNPESQPATAPSVLVDSQNRVLVSSLSSLAIAWATYGSTADDLLFHRTSLTWSFIDGFLKLHTIARGSVDQAHARLPKARDILMHIGSMRTTSKPRDFILAVMPQHNFYKVPLNAKQLTFAQLFLDCCRQLRNADVGLGPLIGGFDSLLKGILADEAPDIPEPTCLGDFVKLVNGPAFRIPEGRHVEFQQVEHTPALDPVKLASLSQLVAEEEDMQLVPVIFTVHQVVRSVFNSKVLWLTVQLELRQRIEALSNRETDKEQLRALVALEFIARHINYELPAQENASRLTYREELMSLLLSVDCETVLLLAAMISCGQCST